MAHLIAMKAAPMLMNAMGSGGAGGASPAAAPEPIPARGKLNVAELWGRMARAMGRFVRRIPPWAKEATIEARVLFAAGIVLGMILIAMYIGYLLVTYAHPRLLLGSRMDITFNSAMDDHCNILAAAIRDVRDRLGSDGAPLWNLRMGDQNAYSCSADPGGARSSSTAPTADGESPSGFLWPYARRLRPAVNKLADRGSLSEDLKLCFKYYRALSSISTAPGMPGDLAHYNPGYIQGIDLAADEAFVDVQSSALDLGKVAKFYEEVFRPLTAVRDNAVELSKQLGDLCNLAEAGWYGAGQAVMTMSIHTLRLYLDDYLTDISFSYETRKKGNRTAIWTLYYVPYITDIYKKRIPAYWKQMPKRFIAANKAFSSGWDKLGVTIGLLPCRMTWSDPVKRDQKCNPRPPPPPKRKPKPKFRPRGYIAAKPQLSFNKNNFAKAKFVQEGEEGFEEEREEEFEEEGGDKEKAKEKEKEKEKEEVVRDAGEAFGEGKEGTDTVEHMSIFSAMQSAGTFFSNLKPMVEGIGDLFKNFNKDPFGTMLKFFGILVGILLAIVLEILYLLFSLTLFIYVFQFLWAWYLTFVIGFLWTVCMVLWTLLIAIPYFFLWLLDLATKGTVVQLMRCENLPDAWSNTPSFAEGNGYRRIGGVACAYPCEPRWKPWGGGFMCKKLPDFLPSMCPQQMIFRAYKGDTLSSPYVFDKFKPPPGFTVQDIVKQEKQIVEAYRVKVGYLGPCYEQLTKYDYVNRHICANIDRLPNIPGGNREKLLHLCSQAYCDYEPVLNTGQPPSARMRRSAPAAFCTRIRNGLDAKQTDFNAEASQLARIMLMMTIGTLCLLVLLYAVLCAPNLGDGPQHPSLFGGTGGVRTAPAFIAPPPPPPANVAPAAGPPKAPQGAASQAAPGAPKAPQGATAQAAPGAPGAPKAPQAAPGTKASQGPAPGPLKAQQGPAHAAAGPTKAASKGSKGSKGSTGVTADALDLGGKILGAMSGVMSVLSVIK
jgi:hypothetical protein